MKLFQAIYENVRSPIEQIGQEEYGEIKAVSWAQAVELALELLNEKIGPEFDLVSLNCSGEIVE